MPDFEIGQYDLLPVFAFTCKQAGAAVDLTGATVEFHMETPAGVEKVNAAAVVTSAAAGQGEYRWAGTDTDTHGLYLAEVEVTFSSGKKQTFPRDVKTQIQIYPKLIQ